MNYFATEGQLGLLFGKAFQLVPLFFKAGKCFNFQG